MIPDPLCGNGIPTQRARDAMQRSGCAGPGQQMGSRWPIGCVALEITQRCNLDCTLCYLSENSESVRDIPLESECRPTVRRYMSPRTLLILSQWSMWKPDV